MKFCHCYAFSCLWQQHKLNLTANYNSKAKINSTRSSKAKQFMWNGYNVARYNFSIVNCIKEKKIDPIFFSLKNLKCLRINIDSLWIV